MNRLLTAALLMVLAASTYAQSSIEVVTKDGRTVILKPDGTWEFKKAAQEPSQSPAVAAVKSSAPMDSLPVNFSGHDSKLLYTQLVDLKKRLLKSEFETTAQYEKRVAEELQKPIIDSLTVKDTFSFVVSSVRAEYDADSQKMRVFLPFEKSTMAELQRRMGAITQDQKKTARDLSYVNLYNIEWAGEGRYDKQGIYFDDVSDFRGFSAAVDLSVEDARRLKSTIKAVVLARFEEPYAAGNEDNRQFQVRLIDFYFFDPQTGKILAKGSQLKTNPSLPR